MEASQNGEILNGVNFPFSLSQSLSANLCLLIFNFDFDELNFYKNMLFFDFDFRFPSIRTLVSSFPFRLLDCGGRTTIYVF